MDKRPPSDSTFLLCEDIRKEQGNKVSLVGVYAGGNVVIYGDELEAGAAIEGLALYGMFKGGVGKFSIRLVLTRPDGSTYERTGAEAELLHDVTHTMIVKMRPFMVPALGVYRFDVYFDEHKFSTEVPISMEPAPDKS